MDIEWDAGCLRVLFRVNQGGIAQLQAITPQGSEHSPDATRFFDDCNLPLNQLRLAGEGNDECKSSKCLIGTYGSARLKYRSHAISSTAAGAQHCEIVSTDDKCMLTVTNHFTIYADAPALRSQVTIKNGSSQDVDITELSSLVVGGMSTSSAKWWTDFSLSYATNSWFREAQWKEDTLSRMGIDDFGMQEFQVPVLHPATHTAFALGNRGSFSTGGHLPMGMLQRSDHKETWLWQVENNGYWRWEVGDYRDSVYLAVTGPSKINDGWSHQLKPGDSFTTVPAALVHVYDDYEAAHAVLTKYRRAMRREHADTERMSIIFNDYMNCLMGDPTEAKVTALIEPAARLGCEYFVIDAGWYADDNDWWDDVGLWEPSTVRFPSGLKSLLRKISDRGMVPGLWLEPEVVGQRSIVAKQLPEEAFFQEQGLRLLEKGRHQLDYRHPAVIQRMNTVIDRLVLEYGVGYFKFDYNIDVTSGTDAHGQNSSSAMLEHNRAYLRWINTLYDRHPNLIIETCSSGGQRLDYALLQVHSLQSTSDQQDPVRYAPIAAAMPTAVTPEQGASWTYPQRSWSMELIAFCVINSMLGRIHLSGRIDQLRNDQLQLVEEGMKVYKSIRSFIGHASPFWPMGLPTWHDEWISLGLRNGQEAYVAVWRRSGALNVTMALNTWRGQADIDVTVVYPVGSAFATEFTWKSASGELTLQLQEKGCARLLRIAPRSS